MENKKHFLDDKNVSSLCVGFSFFLRNTHSLSLSSLESEGIFLDPLPCTGSDAVIDSLGNTIDHFQTQYVYLHEGQKWSIVTPYTIH